MSEQEPTIQDVYDMMVEGRAYGRERLLASTPDDDFPTAYWHGFCVCLDQLMEAVREMLGIEDDESTE